MQGIGIVLIELVAVLAGRALGHVDGVRQPVRQEPLSQELSQLRFRAGRPMDLRNEKSAFWIRRIFERDELHLGGLGHDLESKRGDECSMHARFMLIAAKMQQAGNDWFIGPPEIWHSHKSQLWNRWPKIGRELALVASSIV